MERFVWEAEKAETNLRRHGVDFADAALVFRDPMRLEWLDDREDYGEERYCTVGRVQSHLLFLVYTVRGEEEEGIRLISARKASRVEREAYGNRETSSP